MTANQRAERRRAPRTRARWIPLAWAVLGIVAVVVVILAIAGGGNDKGDAGGSSGGGGGPANLQSYEMPGGEMVPTYAAGSRIEVNQNAYLGAAPKVGDVVAFHPPGDGGEANRIAVERVVAGPGDTFSIEDGKAVKVGAGEYFMLGDNRQASDDSRSWGPIPAGWIIGKVE